MQRLANLLLLYHWRFFFSAHKQNVFRLTRIAVGCLSKEAIPRPEIPGGVISLYEAPGLGTGRGLGYDFSSSCRAMAAISFCRVTMPHRAFRSSTTGTKFCRRAASTTTGKSA